MMVRVLIAVVGFVVLAGAAPGPGPRERAPAVEPGPLGRDAGARRLALAVVDPRPRSEAGGRPERRCTEDGAYCIGLASYVVDVCRVIEDVAGRHALDRGFFARLIWKESLFDAGAVSPAGAQGIAQFMPGTAKLRGLRDAFNPAEALRASARYLAELSRDYGNIGLAAAAYNGGEGRVEKFVAAEAGLPAETRAYVRAITGHPAEAWRDAPPKAVDLALGEGAFQAECVALAVKRKPRGFRDAPPALPWGVVVASNRDDAGAERQVARLRNRHADVLRGETVSYTRGRMPGMGRALSYAQIGRGSRAEADALCGRLRAAGGDCLVRRN
jgi:hypothetical protein